MSPLGEEEAERKFYFQRLDPLIAFKFNLSEIGNSALTKDMCFLVDRWIKVFAGKEYTNATTMYFDLYFSSLLIINFSHFY